MIISQYVSDKNLILIHHTLDEMQNKTIIFGPESHMQYELMFVIQGFVEHHIEGKKYEVQEGDLIIIDINEFHSLKIDLSKTPYERIVLRFYEESITKFNKIFGHLFTPFNISKKYGSRIFKKSIIKNFNIANLFYDLSRIAQKPDKYIEHLLSIKFIEILIELNKIFDLNTDNISPIYQDSFSIQIINYINGHISESITLDEIANNLFLNKFYMCHVFKKNMNISITQYIITKKIYKAATLISSGITAQKAALEVGYTNYSSFFVAYKKIMNKTPSNKL